jgi:predicted Zn-dependent peptidase
VALEAALRSHLEELAAAEPSRAEVERALLATEAHRTIELQQVGTRADQLSMFTTLFDDPERINTEIERYRAVAPAAVQRVAGRFLRPESAATLIYLPLPAEAA